MHNFKSKTLNSTICDRESNLIGNMSKTTSAGVRLQNGGTKRTTTHQTEPGRW